MLKRAMLLIAAACGGTAASAHDPRIPASDLFYEESSAMRRSTWTIDPLLARFPDIVRALRTESLPEAQLGADDCTEHMPCYRSIRHERAFAGERLVSLFTEQSGYYGGAHGGSSASHLIWDRQAGRWIGFPDIFTSWGQARALIQQRFCTTLDEMREDEVECAPVDELAIGLRAGTELPIGTSASSLELRTSDYQLGSYAQGRETVFIPLDEAVLALVRPEYRADFAVSGY
jgi:hypothetical protein